jgi:hypothetical protein
VIYNLIIWFYKAILQKLTLKLKGVPTWTLLLATFIFFVPVFLLYYKESVSFHFIDEYNNFLAGYFLLKGKVLYSQIFFQHQPLMAYISYILQKVLHPSSLYKLVIYHRLVVVLVALLFDLLLVYRFRFVGLLFAIIFELTKYHLFGSTFLAESIVVYPLVYLFGLIWETLHKREVADWEILLSGLLTFFVVFMREPYTITAVVLFAILLIPKRRIQIKISAVGIFLLFSLITVAPLPIHDYLFEIAKVNVSAVAKDEVRGNHLLGFGIIGIFIYPIIILLHGSINYFRGILILLDLLFLIAFFKYFVLDKQWRNGLILLFILGISNIRITPPGTIFFGAYHMIVWYGLFVFSTIFLVKNIFAEKNYNLFKIFTAALLTVFCIYIVLPQNSLIWDKYDKQTVFNNNYAQYFITGKLVQNLSDEKTTFFVDGWDNLSYWQADQNVSFPFLFWYPPMSKFSIYTKARAEMFKNDPPEFVYSNCGVDKGKIFSYTFPEYSVREYDMIYYAKSPTCLYVRKSAVNTIAKEKWNSLNQSGFYLNSK